MNVALQADGLVRGRVVEPDGKPLDGAQVVLRQTDRVVATLVTDARGEFVAAELGSGVYRIETPTSIRHLSLLAKRGRSSVRQIHAR